jgi:succinate dehydrogenase/fumarate reductase-like Fe-S protein
MSDLDRSQVELRHNLHVNLRIQRGAAGETLRFETHQVPFDPGQSVLDALRWVRANVDPRLAIRYSCINANACKECMMRVDGKTVYACLAKLEAREMVVEPLPNKPLVRDLVTEVAPSDEELFQG